MDEREPGMIYYLAFSILICVAILIFLVLLEEILH